MGPLALMEVWREAEAAVVRYFLLSTEGRFAGWQREEAVRRRGRCRMLLGTARSGRLDGWHCTAIPTGWPLFRQWGTN